MRGSAPISLMRPQLRPTQSHHTRQALPPILSIDVTHLGYIWQRSVAPAASIYHHSPSYLCDVRLYPTSLTARCPAEWVRLMEKRGTFWPIKRIVICHLHL